MAGSDKQVALRKRQQIEGAGRTMFMWVAIAAALVGTAGVVGVSLFERMVFNQKVLYAKNATLSNLEHNNEIADELKQNVRVLNTNTALLETPRSEDAEPISVVLDALPATANAEAFGASLQKKLLRVDGVTIDSLSPVSVDEIPENGSVAEISFEFSVTTSAGRADALKKVLKNIERSIRPIDILTLTVDQQNNKITMSAEVRTYYLPETKVELTEAEVEP